MGEVCRFYEKNLQDSWCCRLLVFAKTLMWVEIEFQFHGVITNCGELAPDSRLARLMAVELVVVTAILNVPLPVINEVTLMLMKVLAVLIAPEDPATLPSMAGMLL
jgi:hypothetical protein